MNDAPSALEPGVRALHVPRTLWTVVPVVLIWSNSVLLSGCCGSQTVDPDPVEDPEIWLAPPSPTVLIEDTSHPLFEIVQAIEQADCASVLGMSEALMDRARSEIGEAFHVQATDASDEQPEPLSLPIGREMRSALDRFLYAMPSVIEVNPAGFRFPSWWMHQYAYCLVENDRLEEAALQYLLMVIDDNDPDALWRLALVNSWMGRRNDALLILQSWSFVDRPQGFDRALDTILLGEPIPGYTQPGQTEVD